MEAVLVVDHDLCSRLRHLAAQGLQSLLVAEAVVGVPLLDELFCVLQVDAGLISLALYIGAHSPVLVRPFIVDKPGLFERPVYDIQSTLHEPLLVCVLDAEDEIASRMLRDQIGVQRGPKIAHMHPACGTRCKSCSYFTHCLSPFL